MTSTYKGAGLEDLFNGQAANFMTQQINCTVRFGGLCLHQIPDLACPKQILSAFLSNQVRTRKVWPVVSLPSSQSYSLERAELLVKFAKRILVFACCAHPESWACFVLVISCSSGSATVLRRLLAARLPGGVRVTWLGKTLEAWAEKNITVKIKHIHL